MRVSAMRGVPYNEERAQECKEFCLPTCRIGMEFEWEGVQNYLNARNGRAPSIVHTTEKLDMYYNNHRDGSLRGSSAEFTFRGAYFGTKLLNAILIMEEASRILGFTASYRTSMHVHVDVNDLNFPEDIHAISGIYALSEPLLYKFVRRGREACNYCIPWYFNLGHVRVWNKVLREGGKGPASAEVQRIEGRHLRLLQENPAIVNGNYTANLLTGSKLYKYAGLNFFSLGDLGTLEYRIAPVDMQAPKIITWINILMRMKKYVKEKKPSLNQIVRRAQKEPQELLSEVYEDNFVDLTKMTTTLQQDLMVGIKTATQVFVESIGE